MSSPASTRREWLAAAATLAFAAATPSLAEEAPRALVHRSPTCGCCKAWAGHLRAAGFSVEVIDEADIANVKSRLRVPNALASCHTAEIGGYVVEGHVPVASIRKLLEQKPNAVGLTVPGMPQGSPGMETAGAPDVYEVLLFDAKGFRSFAKYEGGLEI